MLESRSPQLLDEGGELRIAWSQCSLAQIFGAVDIGSNLKNLLFLVLLSSYGMDFSVKFRGIFLSGFFSMLSVVG